MILAAFISQLRAYAPVFEGRVAGAAEFVAGLRNYNPALPLPAAFVVPLPQEAEPNVSWGGLQQVVHIGVGVIVELDAQTDRRGQAPAMNLDDVRDEVFASVLNYKPEDCHIARGAMYSGARPLDLDRARLFFQFEFNIDWQITDADGFQPHTIPLEAVDAYIFGPHGPPAPGTDPAAVVRVVADPDATLPPPDDVKWPDDPLPKGELIE